MATATSNNSGNWGDDIWDGGSGAGGIPADGDAVVIAEGHSVLMNADLSAWTGLTTLTITGSASGTPGMLYFKNGTDGYLKFRTGAGNGLLGTNVANKGRLLANSDGTWRGNKGLTVTGSASGDTLTANSHGLPDTTPISFACATDTDVLPAPLQEGVTYYVRDTATNTFKVAATSGGTAIDLTTDGTGTFGVNTCLAFANKAIILFAGDATTNGSRLQGAYLDISLNCMNPINKYVEVYGTAYTCTDQSTDVNTTTGVITFTSAPPAAGTAVMIKSSGTLPTGLTATDVYYTRTISGNTCQLALLNADAQIVIPSATGSGTLTMYSGHSSTSTKVMNIVQDLTSDGCWVNTTDHNRVVLVDAHAPESYDQQRDQIASIDTSAPFGITITTNNVDSAQYPLAIICLSSRNVSIRSNSTSGSQKIIDAVVGGTFGCEVCNTYAPGTQTTFYCYAFDGCSYNSISGTVSGCTYGLYNSYNNSISGTVSGCSYGLVSSYNNSISGTVCGCSSGLSASYNNSISGTVSGCSYGLNASYNNSISGIVSGCTYGLNTSYNNSISGIVCGCTYGLNASYNNSISGIVSGCSYVSVLRNCANTFRHNRSATQALAWQYRNTTGASGRQSCESEGRVAGAEIIYDAFGDVLRVQCDGVSDRPSADPDGGHGYCIEASNIQSLCGSTTVSFKDRLRIIDGMRIWLTAAAHTVTFKVQSNLSGAITNGNLVLTGTYIGVDGVLTDTTNSQEISVRSGTTDWTETLAVTFTSTQEGWATFSIDLTQYLTGELYVWPEPVIT